MHKLGTSQLPTSWRRVRRLILASALPIALAACGQSIDVRGNLPEPEELSKISPGVHSRTDVASLLGSPSTISTFRDDKWYYIGQKSTQFAFFAPEVLERKIVEISFDPAGVVANSKVYTLEDGQEIDPVERITPTEGREITFFQQLLGNIGKFNTKSQ